MHAFLPHSAVRRRLSPHAGEVLVPWGEHPDAVPGNGGLASSRGEQRTRPPAAAPAGAVTQGRLPRSGHLLLLLPLPHGLARPAAGAQASATPEPGNQRVKKTTNRLTRTLLHSISGRSLTVTEPFQTAKHVSYNETLFILLKTQLAWPAFLTLVCVLSSLISK